MNHSNAIQTSPQGESSPPAMQLSAGLDGADSHECPSCAANKSAPQSFVYAIGKISPKFPTRAIEREFAQVVGRSATSGLADMQLMHEILAKRENRYLARSMCWVLAVEGIETYIVTTRDASDMDLLIASLPKRGGNDDVDVVIGRLGPLANPQQCNGLILPLVLLSQSYSFDVETLLEAVCENKADDRLRSASQDLFTRIRQISDNAGSTDEHRALNYLTVRYSEIYKLAARQFSDNASLTAVEVRPSRLSGPRKLLDVIFTFTERTAGVDAKFYCRIDVTEEFPFLASKLAPYFDR